MTQPTPTVHDIADALIMLAGLVAAERFDGVRFAATQYQADDIRAAMTWVVTHEDGFDGLLLDWVVSIRVVPAPTADRLAAAILAPDSEVPS